MWSTSSSELPRSRASQPRHRHTCIWPDARSLSSCAKNWSLNALGDGGTLPSLSDDTSVRSAITGGGAAVEDGVPGRDERASWSTRRFFAGGGFWPRADPRSSSPAVADTSKSSLLRSDRSEPFSDVALESILGHGLAGKIEVRLCERMRAMDRAMGLVSLTVFHAQAI